MVNGIYANIADFYGERQRNKLNLHRLPKQSNITDIPRQFSETQIRENVP